VTLTEAAERAEVAPATLRSWIRQGLIPQYDGDWTPAAVGQARVVAKVRERGHSLPRIRMATEEGRPGLGGHQQTEDTVSDDELQMLRYVAAVLQDYYARDINIASRVTARAAGGEVLVTRPVVEVAGGGGHLEFERSGEVTLKGFSESTEVFVARQRREESE
jgi:DNA-binding transcriptional MerR regulator